MKKDLKKLPQPEAVNNQNDDAGKGAFDFYRCAMSLGFAVSCISVGFICCRIVSEMFTRKIPVDNRTEVEKEPYYIGMKMAYITAFSCFGVLGILPRPSKLRDISPRPASLNEILKWFRKIKATIQLMSTTVLVAAAMEDSSTDIFGLLILLSGFLLIVLFAVTRAEVAYKRGLLENDTSSISLNINWK